MSQQLAQIINPVLPVAGQGEGAPILASLIATGLQVVFIIGGLGLLFVIIWGAVQWITAGGDSDQLKSAQKKIVGGIIGFVILASAMTIITAIGNIFNIDFLKTLIINWPVLGQPLGQPAGGGGGGGGAGGLQGL